jgi:hypothetical protein
MSTPWVPPRRSYHLRVFALSLLLVVACLVGLLFGVRMEAVVHATGVIEARDQQDVRARLAGVVESGWHEGEITRPAGPPLRARVDGRGDGRTDPTQGESLPVRGYRLADGGMLGATGLRFHKLQAGDELWPGQPLARVHADDLERRLQRLQGRVRDLEAHGQPTAAARAERDQVERQLRKATACVPEAHELWVVLKVRAEPSAAVGAGDALALVAPLDPRTRQPHDPVARLEVADRHRADLEEGQAIRLYPAMYNQRLHGHARATVERVEPWGEAQPGGGRRFGVVARITEAPFALRLGASCKAEVVVGRKQVYRIILEQ